MRVDLVRRALQPDGKFPLTWGPSLFSFDDCEGEEKEPLTSGKGWGLKTRETVLVAANGGSANGQTMKRGIGKVLLWGGEKLRRRGGEEVSKK